MNSGPFLCPICQAPDSDMASSVSHLAVAHNLNIHRPLELLPYYEIFLQHLDETRESDYNGDGLREKCRLLKIDQLIQEQQVTRMATVSRKCLFCKLVPPSRSQLFKHMQQDHSLIVGELDNLVYVDELLSLLDSKLQKFFCLYCERCFGSHVTLRTHMRKSKHFQVNPRNKEYDRFYLVNYLSKQPDVVEEAEDDSQFEDWIEVEGLTTMCLFDEGVFESAEQCHVHLKDEHHFDLELLNDEYDRLRLINFLRSKQSLLQCYLCESVIFQPFDEVASFAAHMASHTVSQTLLMPVEDSECWTDAKYLFPYFEEDPLLLIDFSSS